MAALTSANYNLPSMMGIYQLDMELRQWLSIGGMLAASTPAITLMLIYRGAVTATHFLGRMDGGDYVNEKILSRTGFANPSETFLPCYVKRIFP